MTVQHESAESCVAISVSVYVGRSCVPVVWVVVCSCVDSVCVVMSVIGCDAHPEISVLDKSSVMIANFFIL